MKTILLFSWLVICFLFTNCSQSGNVELARNNVIQSFNFGEVQLLPGLMYDEFMEVKGFEIDAAGQDHSYEVYWTLEVHVTDKNGKAVAGKEVRILGEDGTEILKQLTGQEGSITHELLEYSLISTEKVFSSPYMVIVGKKKRNVNLTSNLMITFISKR